MNLKLNRALGAATVLYSLAIIARPQWLAKPCGLAMDGNGQVPRDTRLLIAAIGARDTAIGVAMLAAGDDRSRRVATACRIAADASDAVLFGTLLKDPAARAKVAGFAAVWAGLCAVSLRSPCPSVVAGGGACEARSRIRRSARQP